MAIYPIEERIRLALGYEDNLKAQIESFRNDPPDTKFQHGYLEALRDQWHHLVGEEYEDFS